MNSAINMEKLADVQRVASKLERLPKRALFYVAGYVDCAVDAAEQARTGERQEGA